MLVIACLIGCKPDSPDNQISSQSEPKTPLTVNVFRPGPGEPAIKTVTYFGTVEPNQKITLGFSVGGTLISAPKMRQTIASDQVIAKLDSLELVEQRNAAQAEIESLVNQFGEDANTQPLKNQIAELEKQIQRRSIIAPFDCLVESVFAGEKSLVGANSPIATIVETGNPKIEVCFPRRISNRLSPGHEVVFTLDDQLINGRLTDKAVTESPPGSIKIWFEITSDMTDVSYAFGSTVEGTFIFDSEVQGHWIPLTSIRRSSEGLWSVFIVDQAGERRNALQKLVDVRQVRDDAAFIVNDLSENLVVLDGVHRIVSGQQVRSNIVELKPSDSATGTAQ